MKRLMKLIGFEASLETKDRFTYIINGFCIGLVFVFLPFYVFVVKSSIVLGATAVCLAILFAVLPFLKARRFMTAKILMIVALFYQVSLLAFLWFPREANFSYFYFVATPIGFFIFDFTVPRERRAIIIVSVLATVLLLLNELTAFPEPLYSLDKGMILIFSGLSVLATLGSMSLVFFFYANNLASAHTKLRHLADTDSLTKTANRRVLFKEGNETFSRARNYGNEFSLLLLDIDRFKEVNDVYGHPAGDAVLSQLSERISKNIRRDDLFSRHGGEEFAVLLNETGPASALKVAEHLRSITENTAFQLPVGINIKITISLGAATYATGYDDFDAVMIDADQALYQAKQSGRNKVVAAFETI